MMKGKPRLRGPGCLNIHRRTFFSDLGMGVTGMALGAMLHRDGVAAPSSGELWTLPDGLPHFHLKKLHGRTCSEVDHPIGGLLKDLKQRGLLGETLVVWGTEFGRTPGVQGQTGGRDHHPPAFSPAGWPVAKSKVESPTAPSQFTRSSRSELSCCCLPHFG